MNNYRIIYLNKDNQLEITIPPDEWLERNNYNFKLLAKKLKIDNYIIVEKDDVDKTISNINKLLNTT